MKRSIRSALAVLALVAGTIAVTGERATADEHLDRARAICGSGFAYVSGGSTLLDPTGAGSARIYLFYSSGTGENCVVTRKYSRHDRKEPMRAGIRVEGLSWKYDPTSGTGNFYEYAGPVKQYGRGKCVQYFGYYNNGEDADSYTLPTGRFCG